MVRCSKCERAAKPRCQSLRPWEGGESFTVRRDGRPPQPRVSTPRPDGRVPILYLAPWVGYGGTDSGTIDWFRSIDRERFAPYLITTQRAGNERLAEVYPYAEEVWVLPEFLGGQHIPSFVFDVIHTRGIGVVHVMNARIGFELIADMAALPHPPGVVVQLHVEEHDKSGYVRLVTTRYGNLVDRFSVISKDLAGAVRDYGVPPEKVAVIPLGVDACGRFDPERVQAVEGLAPERLHILYTGRLTAQKDPLLAVETMRLVVQQHERALLHIVGDGELEGEVRERVRSAGLAAHVTFHPMSRELDRWYAGCDMVLMTSLFEGAPCVVYEAMAMRTPIVAPALAGNRELMGATAGVLVEPRDDAGAYAAAIGRLISDVPERERLGREGRERVLRDFTIEQMADAHAELYEQVLGIAQARERRSAPTASAEPPGEQAPPTIWDAAAPVAEHHSRIAPLSPTRLRFAERPVTGQPLVSVIVPCFNHGRYLTGCIESILEQDYPELEVIVIDDASTEDSTLAVLAELETGKRVSVLRQPENAGPSAARNRGIEAARGRYVLPVDSDNLLMAGAVASLVAQLQAAGEQVGFIYPNCQYFGTRDDYFQPPSYNLFLLMEGNFCDTCSLIDRAVFDAGIRYPEHILLGHEDWDFALTLAARGVWGEPAREPTLLYRKEGFTRSDAVEYARDAFHEGVAQRHPELFGVDHHGTRYGRYWAPSVDIKARWAPALSIVLGTPIDFAGERGQALLDGLERQSYRDFEVVLECPALPAPGIRTQLRRIPPELCAETVTRLQVGLEVATGRYLLLAGEEFVGMVSEPGLLERMLRTMLAHPPLQAIAFTDAGPQGHFPHRLLAPEQIRARAHALLWEVAAQHKLPNALKLADGLEVESLARAMSVNEVALQWRHAAAASEPRSSPRGPAPAPAESAGAWLRLDDDEREVDRHRAGERAQIRRLWPTIPALPWDAIRRWLALESWIPPETELLTRHREIGGERRVVCRGAKSPAGYQLEFHLGAIQRFSPPGTVRLVADRNGVPHTVPRGSPRHEDDEELGHLEEAPLPLLDPIELAVLPDGNSTLVCTDRDPVRAGAVQLRHLGYIESYPNEPVRPPDLRHPGHGRLALLRCLDSQRRRHRYRAASTDALADASVVGELGALHLTAEPGSIAVWIGLDGQVSTDRYRPDAVSPDARQIVRWVGAPAGWRGFGRRGGRARAMLRRGADAIAIAAAACRGDRVRGAAPTDAGALLAGAPVAGATLTGYLYAEPGPRRQELYAALHPVTGDQLLTLHPLEAADMGYGPAVGLGYVLVDLPFTGTHAMRRVAVPWASRFGLEVRRA
jgi:glycosyltransferase involved in cell wall biosynthesis